MFKEARRLNMYFRNGSPTHVFEYGQTKVPDWRGKSEAEVLCHRVQTNQKPLASIVIENKAYLDSVLGLVREFGLLQTHGINPWGVVVVSVIRAKDSLLGQYLTDEEKARFRCVEPTADTIFQRRLGHYLAAGAPDMSKGDSALECGLAYGYDLEQTIALY